MGQVSGPRENSIEHRRRQSSGEGVLLAHVIAVKEFLAIGENVNRAVGEGKGGQGEGGVVVSIVPDEGVVSDSSQAQVDPTVTKPLQVFG